MAVGWRYFNACPINPLIPHYLVVAGTVGLVFIILITISQMMARTFAKKISNETIDRANPNRTTILVGCGVCSIMCINLSLFIFLMGWTVAGCIWVFEVWHRVQYYQLTSNDYCHRTLYQFTFSLLLFTILFKILFFSLIFRTTCVKVNTVPSNEVVATKKLQNP